MDWMTLITSATTLIAGGGWFVNWRANRKKAAAEADSAAVAAMKDALEEIRKSNDFFQSMHDKDTAAIAGKNREILELTADNVTLKMMVCRHDACPFREPPKGRGGEWYEAHKHDDFPTDTEPITVIGRRNGYYVRRLPAKETGKGQE